MRIKEIVEGDNCRKGILEPRERVYDKIHYDIYLCNSIRRLLSLSQIILSRCYKCINNDIKRFLYLDNSI